MKFFRKKKNARIILWITAILIIPGFLIWGVGISGGGRTRYLAATVNREGITQREYYQQLNQVEQNYRRFFGDRFDEIARNLNLEKAVLEELIREKLLTQQVRRRHIRVTDSEVIEAIKSDPAFRDEQGKFSQDKFSRIIAQIPPEELSKIEEDTRHRLLQQKLKQDVVAEGNLKVTDQEVKDYLEKNKGSKADEEQVRKMLLWQKEEKYFHDWYEQIRQKAKVTVYMNLPQPAPVASSASRATSPETSVTPASPPAKK